MKRNKIKRSGFFVLMILTILLFSGCGEKKEKPVEITLIHGWGTTEGDHEAMRKIYQDFEKENPDIR